uniref:Uncharacterized protein n=1 Tax=Globodera pallida TaxID=36090 RepID=A0A183CEV2_GLOPA
MLFLHFKTILLSSVTVVLLTAVRTLGEEDERINDSFGGPMALVVQQQQQSAVETAENVDEDETGRHVPSTDDASNRHKYCEIHDNEPLHALMDQICELCHDFFSHVRPNTRVQCRAECFLTATFKKCLQLFIMPNRSRRREQMQLVMAQ